MRKRRLGPRPTVPASQSFPYLAPPNPNLPVANSAVVFPAKLADQIALIGEAITPPATR